MHPANLRHRLCATLVASLAGAAPLAAAVGGSDLINDLRFSVGIVPGVDGPSDRDTNAGPRFGLSYFSSVLGDWRDWGGWVGGGEFSVAPTVGKTDDGTKVRALTSAFTAFFGVAHRLAANEHIHLEGTPFLGIGLIQDKIANSSDTETYWEIGLRAAGFWTFDNGWQLGIDIRLTDGRTVNGDYDQRGLAASAVGGYRF